MKIRKPSYKILFSEDEQTLFSVGGTVSAFDVSGEKAVELLRLNSLKNPSRITVSSDEKLLAYSNTSGHIAVHDIDSGKLLIKSKCLSEEGNSLFFLKGNKQIISSGWDGRVFILCLESGDVTVIFDGLSIPEIIPIFGDDYLVLGSDISDEIMSTSIFKISLGGDVLTEELHSALPYVLQTVSTVRFKDEVFFCESIARGRSFNARDSILSFNLSTNEMTTIFCVNEVVNKKDLIGEFGIFTSMCISSDGRCLLIGYSDAVIAFDLFKKKLIGTVEMKYVSSLKFLSLDKRAAIGTWTNTHIIDFETLLDGMC